VVYALLFVAVWFNAVLRTFNNLRVMRLQYETAIPVALVTSFVDVCVIASVIKLGIWVFIPVGLGFGCGQITAGKIYEWRRRKCRSVPPENELDE
jgi:hypothetical protein